MLGLEIREEGISVTLIDSLKFIDVQLHEWLMESSQILIAGVGGIGCSWAKGAWSRCDSEADILLIDADDESFSEVERGHVLRLGTVVDKLGCASLPPLAEQRMRSVSSVVSKLMEPVELVILLTGLGGGTGTGAAHEFARQARLSGAIVIAVSAMPFAVQSTRLKIAEDGKIGSSYHISGTESIMIKDLVHQISDLCGVKLEDFVEQGPDRPGKDSAYLLDSSSIREELNWEDKIKLSEGLNQTLD